MKHPRRVWPLIGAGTEAEHIDGIDHGTRRVIGMKKIKIKNGITTALLGFSHFSEMNN